MPQERYEALLASRDQQLGALMAELQRLRQGGSSSTGTSACSQGDAGGREGSEEPQARHGAPPAEARQHMQHAQHAQHATSGPVR